jgi:amino acid transporter
MIKKHNTNIVILFVVIALLFFPTKIYANNTIIDSTEYESNVLNAYEEENKLKQTIVIVAAGISLVVFFYTAIFGEKDDD